jgi:hypothetical protein
VTVRVSSSTALRMRTAWHSANHFIVQCTQQLTDLWEEFLLGPRYLIHGRDTKFSRAFDRILPYSGVETLVLPPRSPNLNPYWERSLRCVLPTSLTPNHHERNHHRLANQLMAPKSEVVS